MSSPDPLPPTPIDLPVRVFVKLFAAALVVYLFLKAASILMLLLMAVLIATTLFPIQERMIEKGVPRLAAFLLLAILTVSAFGAFLFLLLPKIIDQLSTFPQHLTDFSRELLGKISNEGIRAKIESFVKDPPKLVGNIPDKVVAVSSTLMGAFFSIGLMLVMSLYLLADGKNTYRWVRAFFSPVNQEKLDVTAEESSKIISAYVAGQLITSAFVAIFVFGLLTLMKVPGALAVATLAAIFDVLPMIGFLIALGAAGLIALTVSSSTALIVMAAFFAYHLLENYVIVPRIYGNRMKLSGLVVLLSLVFAVEIGGILAGIVILPIIAAFPIIEKIWLRRALGAPTLAAHAEIEASTDPRPKVDA